MENICRYVKFNKDEYQLVIGKTPIYESPMVDSICKMLEGRGVIMGWDQPGHCFYFVAFNDKDIVDYYDIPPELDLDRNIDKCRDIGTEVRFEQI